MAATDNITVSSDQQSATAQVSDASELHEHSQSCNDPTHQHNFPSYFDQNDLFSTLAAPKTETPAKRKHKKKPKEGIIRAEAIPGHRGNDNIDDLMNFINSPPATNEKKQKKKSPTTSTTN
jgi:hypothetical protein